MFAFGNQPWYKRQIMEQKQFKTFDNMFFHNKTL